MGLRREIAIFRGCPRSMQLLLASNMIYALVLPVIEVFVAAYVMRNSRAVSRVVTYQLALYVATPVSFLINGLLLKRVGVKRLYGTGMVLSGVAMLLLMRSGELTLGGIAMCGLSMGLSTGLFWANRGFLALATTHDGNRNYYYGVETFAATLAAVVVPATIGWFVSGTTRSGWMGGSANGAYRVVAATVFGLTVVSAGLLQRGSFRNPEFERFVYFRFPPLWRQMLTLASLKGLAQGYIITAPAMLVMQLLGKEGTLGATQAIGGVLSALVLYAVGRTASTRHRKAVFATALLLFFAGAATNAVLFDGMGVLVFMACLVLAKPMLDLGYNPIEMRVIDVVAAIEERSEYAYFVNHEFGLFTGRVVGCGLFLEIAAWWSGEAALRYALVVIAAVQLLSIPVAGGITRALKQGNSTTDRGEAMRAGCRT